MGFREEKKVVRQELQEVSKGALVLMEYNIWKTNHNGKYFTDSCG